MGWASGMAAGSKLARDIIDARKEEEQRQKILEIQKASVSETRGLTAPDAAQLEAIRNARTPEGLPYYNVQEFTGRGVGPSSYDVTPNSGAGGGFVTQYPEQASVAGLAPTPRYAPGELENLDAQFRTPVAFEPQVTGTKYLGREYGLTGPSEPQKQIAQMNAYADAVAVTNPLESQRMRLAAAQEARAQTQFEGAQELQGLQLSEAKRTAQRTGSFDEAVERISNDTQLTAPLKQKAIAEAIAKFKSPEAAQTFLANGTAAELSSTQLANAQRALKEGQQMDAFNIKVAELRKTNPNFGAKDMQRLAEDMGLPLSVQDSYVAAMANISKNSITMLRQEVESKFSTLKNYKEAISEFNTNDKLDPNTDLKERAGPNGSIVIDLVDKKGKVLQKDMYTFSNAAEAFSGLYKAATDPAQMGDWALKNELTRAEIAEKKGRAAYLEGGGARRPGGLSSGSADAASAKKADTLIRMASNHEKSIANIDKQLADLRGNSPEVVKERDALKAKRNTLSDKYMKAMDNAEALISGEGAGLQREGAAPPQLKKGESITLEDRGEIVRFNGGDPKDPNNYTVEKINAAPAKKIDAAPAKKTDAAPVKKNEAVDLANDPVLKSLRESVAKLNPSDPADSAKMMAYGKAKNERIAELKKRYGSMTELKTD